MHDENSAQATETFRINVSLFADVNAALLDLQKSTGVSKTDVVNRAVKIYDFVNNTLAKGETILVRDETGEMREIKFIF